MYDATTGQRLSVYDDSGDVLGDHVIIGNVTIN